MGGAGRGARLHHYFSLIVISWARHLMINSVELYQTWATELANVHRLLSSPHRDWNDQMYHWLEELMHHYVSIPYNVGSLL